MIHELKISPEYYMDVVSGAKTFEIRKNDRDFKVGDYMILKGYVKGCGYTGKKVMFEITYVMTEEEYVKEGFAVLGIRRCTSIRSGVSRAEKKEKMESDI